MKGKRHPTCGPKSNTGCSDEMWMCYQSTTRALPKRHGSVGRASTWSHTVTGSTTGSSFEPLQCLFASTWKITAQLPCWPTKRLTGVTPKEDFWECVTRMPLPSTKQAAHSCFKTERRHHQKSKTGVSLAHKKDLDLCFAKIKKGLALHSMMKLKFYLNRVTQWTSDSRLERTCSPFRTIQWNKSFLEEFHSVDSWCCKCSQFMQWIVSLPKD